MLAGSFKVLVNIFRGFDSTVVARKRGQGCEEISQIRAVRAICATASTLALMWNLQPLASVDECNHSAPAHGSVRGRSVEVW